jgi:hypothetical protein
VTTITVQVLPPRDITTEPRPSWLTAWAEALVGALSALLAGPASVDPAVGFHR